MMDAKYLAEIKAREQAATPGEWKSGGCPRRIRKDLQSVYREIGCYDGQMDICRDATPTDAAFIAHARADIPELLSEMERLTDIEKEYFHYRRLSEKLDQQIATLKNALSDMLFAYQNKDGDCPHQFEIEAIRKANGILQQAQEQEGKK